MRDDPLDDRPRPAVVHEIGQDLARLSTAELDERVALLEREIARLREDRARKAQSRDAASAVFKL